MPYIGQSPEVAQRRYESIDDISGSFNGSTTSFALQVGGVTPAPFPVASENVLISVGGVIQEPDGTGTNGFQLTGTNIVFSSAPAAGQSFFGVILAGADYVTAGHAFPDGDLASPSVTFASDLDTGLFRPDSGALAFGGNGAERLRVDGSGRLLLGTTTEGEATADNFTIADSGHCGITLRSGTSSVGTIFFSDGTSGTDEYRGYVQYDHSGNFLKWATDATERLRLDSSGRLGVNTTSLVSKFTIDNGGRADPSSTGSTTQSNSALEINADTETNTRLMAGMSTGSKFWMQVQNTVGNTTDDILLNPIGGRIGIGTTGPLARTHLDGTDNDIDNVLLLTAANLANGAGGRISFGGNYDGTNRTSWADIKGSKENATSGQYGGYLSLSTRPNGGANTERMRIRADGKIFVNNTSLNEEGIFNAYSNGSTPAFQATGGSSMSTSQAVAVFDKHANVNTTSQVFINFRINDQNTGSGRINANGASQAAFGSFSDRRLKENIVDLPSQLDNVCKLRPVEFDYIESEGGGHQTSFIAQEFEEVFPDAVGEREDGMKTLTGWGKTEAILVKALQEAVAKIEILQAKVAALDAG